MRDQGGEDPPDGEQWRHGVTPVPADMRARYRAARDAAEARRAEQATTQDELDLGVDPDRAQGGPR